MFCVWTNHCCCQMNDFLLNERHIFDLDLFLPLWFFLSSNKIEALSTRWPSSEECPSAGLQIWLTSLHQAWIIHIWLHFIWLRKCFVSWPATETTIKKSVVWRFHNLFLTLFAWLYFVSISLFKWAAVKVNDAWLEPKMLEKDFWYGRRIFSWESGLKPRH